LDVPILLRAWERVVANHPALRTAFRWHDVEWPVQEVYANASLPVRQEDWRPLGRAEQETRLREFLAADRQEGFDLRTRPLLRLTFFGGETSIIAWCGPSTTSSSTDAHSSSS